MAVGTKDGKTLLGVGHMISVDAPPTSYTGGNIADASILIGSNTKYVVFGLTSVKTGLAAAGKPAGVDSSFVATTAAQLTESISNLGGTEYPTFSLRANNTASPVDTLATYSFGGAADKYKDFLVGLPTTSAQLGEVAVKRIPRYMEGGRYLIARGRIDTKTQVAATAVADGGVVSLKFTVPSAASGIFSFLVDVPVNLLLEYNAVASPDLDENAGTNGGYLQSVNWHLRTGFGSDLYSLDDGLSSGGCVLMGVNVGSLDWLEIQWVWEKAAP